MQTRRLGRSGPRRLVITLGTMTFGEQNTLSEGFAQMDRARDGGRHPVSTRRNSIRSRRSGDPGADGGDRRGHGCARGRRRGRWRSRPRWCRTVMTWFPRRQRSPGRDAAADHGGGREVAATPGNGLHRPLPDPLAGPGNPGFGSNPTRWTTVPRAPDENAIEETAAVFADLVRPGKIRWFGLSNESPWGTMRWAFAAERGSVRVQSPSRTPIISPTAPSRAGSRRSRSARGVGPWPIRRWRRAT